MVVPDPRPALRWSAHGLTDRGLRRRRNEDALLVAPAAQLFAVADGMGGHAAGNVASRLAIATLEASFSAATAPPHGAAGVARALVDAFALANRALLAHAAAHPQCAGMGTTLTALAPVASSPQCVVAHVGDSRAYLLRSGELVQLTRDHTWVQTQVDAGILTREAARHHARASLLNRVLGVDTTQPADTVVVESEPGDVLLLCSDGLTSMVDEGRVLTLLQEPLPLAAQAQALVAEANRYGGVDNITVVLLRAEPA